MEQSIRSPRPARLPRPRLAQATQQQGASPFARAVMLTTTSFLIVAGLSVGGIIGGYTALLFYFLTMVAVIHTVPSLAFGLFLVSLFFQGVMTALSLNADPLLPMIEVPQASSVVFAVAGGGVSLAMALTKGGNKELRNAALWAVPPLAVIALYAAYGLTNTSASSVAAYVRVFAAGWLLYLCGLRIAPWLPRNVQTSIVSILSLAIICYGVVEFVFPQWLYQAANIAGYLAAKAGNLDAIETAELSAMSRSYLNLTGQYGLGFSITALMGPNLHIITFGYICAILATYALVWKRYLICTLLVGLMLLVGSKGAIALFLLYVLARVLRVSRIGKRFGWIVEACGYVAFVLAFLAYGYATRDYHYMGLVGGILGFFQNPLGYGIGIGGNLSDLGRAYSMEVFRAQGYASFGVESALGVLLYQLGLATAVVLFCYARLLRLLRDGMQRSQGAQHEELVWARVLLTALLVNGLFQEEAFSPAVMGTVMLFCGLAIRRAPAPAPSRSPRPLARAPGREWRMNPRARDLQHRPQ